MKMKIKDLFDKHLSHVKINKTLSNSIFTHRMNYLNSVEDHALFYSGVLFLVHGVSYHDARVTQFFSNLLDVDENEITDDYDLVPGIRQDWKVTSDVFNLTLMYLTHRFINSTLPTSVVKQATENLQMLFQYRTVGALLTKWRKFKADESVAIMTYESISNRFILKQSGSWQGVVEHRVNHTLNVSKKTQKTLKKFKRDRDVIDLVDATQGAMKSHIVEMYSVMVAVYESGERINSSSNTMATLSGDETIIDVVGGVADKVDKLVDMVHLGFSYNKDIGTVVSSLVNDDDDSNIKEIIESLHLLDKKYMVEEWVKLYIPFVYGYIVTNELDTTDLGSLLINIRGMLSSSRNKEPSFLDIRKRTANIAAAKSSKKDRGYMSSVSSQLSLYIFIVTVLK